MTPHDELDPLADLLSNVSLPPTDPVLREAIFAQTRGVLRRRRWMRRGTWAAAFTACYAIGVISGLAWQPARANNQLAVQPRGEVETDRPPSAEKPELAPDSSPALPEPPHSQDGTQNTIARVEPSDPSLTTFEKLRRAGDRQLNGRGNLQGAIGCYRRALDYASDDELQIVPERDSWLLIPLKEARLETRKNDHKKS